MPDETVPTSHEIAVLSQEAADALRFDGGDGEKVKVIIRPTCH